MDTLEKRVARYGQSLIINLHILVRMTSIYDAMNEAILNAAGRLASDLGILLEDTGEITIKIIQGSYYIEGIRIKAGVSDVEGFYLLAEELGKKSIGMFDFRAPVTPEDLITLTYALKQGREISYIQAALEGNMTRSIALGGPVFLQKEEGIDLKDSMAVARRAYTKARTVVREMDTAVKSGSRIELKRVKRVLQLIVDSIMADESYLLGFALARTSGDHFCRHAANVLIFSAALGKSLGFDRLRLRKLAMAAFFHDAGKMDISLAILNKNTAEGPLKQELIKRHPIEGIKVIAKSFGLNEFSILSMIVSYEHHMTPDGSGYPAVPDKRSLCLFSRIVRIASDFDSLVSGAVGARNRDASGEALKLMSDGSGTAYDRLLLRAFTCMF